MYVVTSRSKTKSTSGSQASGLADKCINLSRLFSFIFFLFALLISSLYTKVLNFFFPSLI